MVLYSTDKPPMYHQLAALEQHARRQSPGHTGLQFHNFVNNADLVPRLLGTSLRSVHDGLEKYISSIKVDDLLAEAESHLAQAISNPVNY